MPASMSEMLLLFPLMYLMNQIDWTIERNVFVVKVLYLAVVSSQLAILFVIFRRINSKNDATKITVAPPPFAPNQDPQEMTICEYDFSEVKKAAMQIVVGVCLVMFINYKWEIVQPLFFQCVFSPIQFSKNPLFKIYVLGKKGEIENRPFKEENPFASLFPKNDPPKEIPKIGEVEETDESEQDSDQDVTSVRSNKKKVQ